MCMCMHVPVCVKYVCVHIHACSCLYGGHMCIHARSYICGAYMCVCVSVCVCVCMEARGQPWMLFFVGYHPPCFFERVSNQDLGLGDYARSAGQEPQGSICL